jgi:hypothetical protein
VLSAQRYKEPRYLVSVAPMIAALGAAGALWVIAGVVRILGRNGIGAIGTGLVLLGLVGVTYGRSCRVIQRRLWFQPFGSYLQAAETIPEEARPATVGLERRWLLSLEHPVRATGGWAWFSRDFATFDLANAVSFFQARPSQWDELPARRVVDELDYVLIPPPQTPAEMGRQRWLNDRTLFDGYFFDRHENETACIRLRRCDDSGGNGPFWNTDDRRAREGAAMAEFTAGVKLVGFDATVLPTAPDGVKFDVRWRLPDTEGLRVIAIVSVMNEWRGMLARYQSWLLPGDETGQRERRGAALRDTHYTSLLARPAGGDLHVEVRVVVIEEGQSPMVQRLSVPGREEVLEGPAAVFPLVVPQRTAPATPPANAAEPPLPPPRG